MSKSLIELKNKNTRLYTKIKDIDSNIDIIRGLLYTYSGLSKENDTLLKDCVLNCINKRNNLVLQHNKITFILNMLEQDLLYR